MYHVENYLHDTHGDRSFFRHSPPYIVCYIAVVWTHTIVDNCYYYMFLTNGLTLQLDKNTLGGRWKFILTVSLGVVMNCVTRVLLLATTY